jgi:hypothetical protein
MFPAYYHNEKARHFDESSLVLQTTPEFSTQNSGILFDRSISNQLYQQQNKQDL